MEKSRDRLIHSVADRFQVQEKQIRVRKSEESVTALISFIVVQTDHDEIPLFVKQNRGDFLAEDNKKEILFYSWIKQQNIQLPIPECHVCQYDDDTGQSLLVLDDHSHSHHCTQWPLPPVMADCRKAIQAMAKVHASLWEHPALGDSIGSIPTPADIEQNENRFSNTLELFSREMEDRFSPAYKDVFQAAISNYYPLVSNRLINKDKLTLCHGDLHAWNFMYPKDSENSIYIIDWQSCNADIGAEDLAYMVGLHWTSERRQRYEMELLSLYYDSLIKGGVNNYSWDQCFLDYRIAVIGQFFVPLWQWESKVPPYFWWPHIERAVQSFRDLECEELLTS
ncbi:MAG: DUF1679 domain-containing protein [Desulfobacteraceae bacterium]|nr:MAG: DUF1679 domain-containing protein [Desulfobacteraceae bacterium]